jgi:hypothetical protein
MLSARLTSRRAGRPRRGFLGREKRGEFPFNAFCALPEDPGGGPASGAGSQLPTYFLTEAGLRFPAASGAWL